MKFFHLLLCVALLGFGCSAVPRPQKGGKARAEVTADGQVSEAVQPENPSAPASQMTEWVEEQMWTLPAGSQVTERHVKAPAAATKHEAARPAETNEVIYLLSESTPVKKTITKKSQATTGGSHKDEGRILGVKMDAFRPVMIAGLVALAAAGALFYFGNYLAGAIAAVVGVAMLVLFATLPQHGMWIMGVGLGGGALLIALLFLAYYKGKDVNHNGVPDILEGLLNKVNKPKVEEK